MNTSFYRLLFVLFMVVSFVGCREDETPFPIQESPLPSQSNELFSGFYLLNEGNMNANKASLDFYDYKGFYLLDLFSTRNPSAVKGLGDVGNDLKIYGSKIYVVVNISNKLEILDAKTATRLQTIDIKGCRFIAFANGKAYVTAYGGKMSDGVYNTNGFVAEIDTLTYQKRELEVGRQPEELAVVDSKLYVANSGGYNPSNYENSVSVIDLQSFKKIKEIELAINLYRLKADEAGNLYITSKGNYVDQKPQLFIFDPKSESVKKQFDLEVENFTILGNRAYFICSQLEERKMEYKVLDLDNGQFLDTSYIKEYYAARIRTPYGVAIDPFSKNVYVTDATDYVTPGKLFCFNPAGEQFAEVRTGDIPTQIAFVLK